MCVCVCVYSPRDRTQDQLKILHIEMHQPSLAYQTPQLSCTVAVTVLSPAGHVDDQELQEASVAQDLPEGLSACH